jgi:hypothetical protein
MESRSDGSAVAGFGADAGRPALPLNRRNASATTAAAISVRTAAMAAVGAIPASKATRAESIRRWPKAGGRVWATEAAPPMLSLASAACTDVRPPGSSTLAR